MGEQRHNAYYGVAALMGASGVALWLSVAPERDGWFNAGVGIALGLIVVALLLFFLTATDRLPGLRSTKVRTPSDTPRSVTSYNQQGGTTAGTINHPSRDDSEPK